MEGGSLYGRFQTYKRILMKLSQRGNGKIRGLVILWNSKKKILNKKEKWIKLMEERVRMN